MLESAARNLLDPAVLFFVLGCLIGLARSNLEIPAPIVKFLSLYLLVAIGLKGGATLAVNGLSTAGALALIGSVFMAFLVPVITFLLLRRRIDPFNAAAVAGTYGSVSAVTFIAAQNFLSQQAVQFGGHMAVAMVLMETPAIIMAVVLAGVLRSHPNIFGLPASANTNNGNNGEANTDNHGETLPALSLGKVIHEAITYGAHLLLIGSLVVGFLAGANGQQVMKPFADDLFKGMLAFFLLEMGLLVGRQFADSEFRLEPLLTGFALVAPVVYGTLGIAMSRILGLTQGDAVLLATLSASASYIIVPAILRYAIPEARPGIYFTMALGLTFPFNIVLGIPLYYEMSRLVW